MLLPTQLLLSLTTATIMIGITLVLHLETTPVGLPQIKTSLFMTHVQQVGVFRTAGSSPRARGSSVRCLQVIDEVAGANANE